VKLTMPFLKVKIGSPVLLAVIMAAMVPSTRAQFAGPAPGNDTGVNHPLKITTDPALLFPPDREPTIGGGDLLAVHIYGSTEYNPTARVSLDGSIALPLAGVVRIQGLTLTQAEHAIAEHLVAGGMYRDPQVSIQVMETPNQIITVTGETRGNVGVVPALGRRRLFDVIAAAGGLPPTASHVVTVLRPGQDAPLVIDLGNNPANGSMANVPLFAGDTLVIARTGVIYALGAFKLQSAIPLVSNSPLTVLQAITIAGGPNFEGKREDTRIIRTEGTRRIEVKVNMSRVIAGKDPDPVLQPDDILYLPTSSLKAAIRAGGIATLMGVAQLSSYITLNSH